MDARGHVPGERPSAHRAQFYGLSTCVWCKRARALLEELGVAFDFAYVDLLGPEERESVLAQLGKFGRGETFPTLIVDGSVCVIGFNADEIRKALK
jgi:glutaredoxin